MLALAESIEETGLGTPITVREGASPNTFILVMGLHRLEAFRVLGRETIPAYVRTLTETEARLLEITENLKRNELTGGQRAEQITEYATIVRVGAAVIPHDAEKVGRPVDPTSRVQVAEKLGITEDALRRAELASSITQEAKDAIAKTGLPDTQALRLKVAKVAPAQQADVVRDMGKDTLPQTDKPKAKRQPSRQKRWDDALDSLTELLDEYQSWRDSIPEALTDSPVVEKLDAVLELRDTVEELQGADLPKGFGRD